MKIPVLKRKQKLKFPIEQNRMQCFFSSKKRSEALNLTQIQDVDSHQEYTLKRKQNFTHHTDFMRVFSFRA